MQEAPERRGERWGRRWRPSGKYVGGGGWFFLFFYESVSYAEVFSGDDDWISVGRVLVCKIGPSDT